MSKYIAVFPGREAFYKGLSKSFYREYKIVRDIFKEASTFMGEDLEYICYENPNVKPELHTTCLITHCYAMYNALGQTLPSPLGVAGFSQGEFTALAIAQSLRFPQVLELVYRLESLIYRSPIIMDGKMMRVVGLQTRELEKCCKEVDTKCEKVTIAIYLSDEQNIISGDKKAVEKVADMAKKRGARWIIDLNSIGTFHSPLCQSILRESDVIFDQYNFSDAQLPVYCCIDGRPWVKGLDLKSRLTVQIARSVQWSKVIKNIRHQGIKHIVEIGPGCTVSGNSRLADPDMECVWINDTRGIGELKATI
ncbi:ACP S-malonyltransferase [Wukongibacter sp. M2B1]|uniref:ACP S-malonyltransferase n=1 Tax=Wukongibacter sp. M2B1 TaxID=3088895 RepID=UPI003D7A9CC7